jgi:vacuolar-type H+-ATPase subunit I/STV1
MIIHIDRIGFHWDTAGQRPFSEYWISFCIGIGILAVSFGFAIWLMK